MVTATSRLVYFSDSHGVFPSFSASFNSRPGVRWWSWRVALGSNKVHSFNEATPATYPTLLNVVAGPIVSYFLGRCPSRPSVNVNADDPEQCFRYPENHPSPFPISVGGFSSTLSAKGVVIGRGHPSSAIRSSGIHSLAEHRRHDPDGLPSIRDRASRQHF